MNTGFRDRLKDLLEESEILTQAELAAKAHVTPATVSGWLNGSTPYAKHMQKLCQIFGVRRDWLAYGEGEKEMPSAPAVVRETALTHYGKGRTREFVGSPLNPQVISSLIDEAASQPSSELEGLLSDLMKELEKASTPRMKRFYALSIKDVLTQLLTRLDEEGSKV